MATSLAFTVIGPDRPGLVELLSRTVTEHGGNWLDSRMSVLSGHFAGIVLVSVPEAKMAAVKRALLDLQGEGLRLIIESTPGAAPRQTFYGVNLALVGQDHPGIVRDVSHVLHERGVNIGDLVTESVSGPLSGETLFKLVAELEVPEAVTTETLRQDLEALANDIMVDIELKAPDKSPP